MNLLIEMNLCKTRIVLILIMLCVILSVPIITYTRANYNTHTEEIIVKKAERVNTSRDGKYLVFSTDNNVYEITDSYWWWSFDASDRYAIIEPNTKYKCVITGWRCRFLSDYPNLIKIEKIEE